MERVKNIEQIVLESCSSQCSSFQYLMLSFNNLRGCSQQLDFLVAFQLMRGICLLVFCFQRQFIPIKPKSKSFWLYTMQYAALYLCSLVVIICLSFFLLNSWDFIPSVYGFM